jgi:hypothetical protein
MTTTSNAKLIDLTNPDHAYMFGFIQADGHMESGSRNRGRVSIGIKASDRHILEEFQKIIPVNSSIHERTRDTNFQKGHTSVCLNIHDYAYRTALNELGLPYGPKSSLVQTPKTPYAEVDYFRGLVDADGSVGTTGQGLPFLSFCTKSPYWADAFVAFAKSITGLERKIQANRRDSVYNMTFTKEGAQHIAQIMYYPGALCLERKRLKAQAMLQWTRPLDMRRVPGRKLWVPREDDIVLTTSVPEAMALLGRSADSIEMRYWRLTHQKRSDDLEQGLQHPLCA